MYRRAQTMKSLQNNGNTCLASVQYIDYDPITKTKKVAKEGCNLANKGSSIDFEQNFAFTYDKNHKCWFLKYYAMKELNLVSNSL